MARIFRSILLLDDRSALEFLLLQSEETFLTVAGISEYEPLLCKEKVNFREFLTFHAKQCEFTHSDTEPSPSKPSNSNSNAEPFYEPAFVQKLRLKSELLFRLQYIRDVILIPPVYEMIALHTLIANLIIEISNLVFQECRYLLKILQIIIPTVNIQGAVLLPEVSTTFFCSLR